MIPGGGGFTDLLRAFNALGPEERKAALELAEQECAPYRFIPNPGPQTAAYYSEADEMFYGGSGGGGKTMLMCGLAVNGGHTDIQIFRREAVQLRGVIKELTKILGSTQGFNSQLGIWRLPGGQTIELAGLKDEDDKYDWQGREGDLKMFDEITHFSRLQYKFVIGWNRSTRPGQRCRIVCAGNPPMDENGLWVIAYWRPWLDDKCADPAQPGELRWPVRASDDDDEDREIFFHSREEAIAHLKTLRTAPRDLEGNIIAPRSRTFIPAALEDNPDLMRTGYAAVIEGMPAEIREAMKGKFRTTFADDEWQVIPTQWIIDAQERWRPEPPKGELMTAMGVDIAQGGADRTVLAPRYGDWFGQMITKPGRETPDGPTAAAFVVLHMRDGAAINIDLGGGWGGPCFGHLKGDAAADVFGIMPGVASSGRALEGGLAFRNIRAEMWWRMREALDPMSPSKIALPPDPELRAELAAPRYKTSKGGDGGRHMIITLEEKSDIRKRLGRSPDKGDAVVMAWFSGDNKRRRREHAERRAKRVGGLPTMANLGPGRATYGTRITRSAGQGGESMAYADSGRAWRDEQG